MRNIGILLILLVLFTTACGQSNHDKIRILILTDIENEPDDAQSMVRFLTYANMFDVEGLVATTSCWQRDQIADWRIHEIVDAYGEVQKNLEKHEKGYPPHAFLKEIIKRGYPDFGMNAVGKDKDSEGSEWIIKVVDQDDPRPVWIPVWGGANCLAQALWKVKETRPPDQVDKFVKKLRVYTISDQDDAGPWMRKTFPNLFYICSPGYHENEGNSYFYATWIGISGERNYHFPSGADKEIIDNGWVDDNIQEGHGPLGAQYPDIEYIMEGDSPSFMYLLNNGLNEPEKPDWGSWGGRYAHYTPHPRNYFHIPETRAFWSNTDDRVNGNDGLVYINAQATIWRWRKAYQNDFAARIDWTIMDYGEANHPPFPVLNHDMILKVKGGEKVNLDASKSKDPDNDNLKYDWIYYKEVGSFGGGIKIENDKEARASFMAPKVGSEETIHIILAVSDNGDPALTRYKRVIIHIYP